MSKLVDELKKEHVQIVEILGKVNSFGISTKDGQDALKSAKAGLLAHLKKEDTQLYVVLQKEAQRNADLEKLLSRFSTEMKDIAKAALEFFSKFEKGGSGIEFARDYGRLISVLTQRISKEETQIYQAYNQLVDK